DHMPAGDDAASCALPRDIPARSLRRPRRWRSGRSLGAASTKLVPEPVRSMSASSCTPRRRARYVGAVAPRLVGAGGEAGTGWLGPASGSLGTIMVCVLTGDDNPAGTTRVTHRRWRPRHSAWALG